MFDNILVVAPHPDDDILGCGGLMHRIARSGGYVTVLYVNLEQLSRKQEIENALDLLPRAPRFYTYDCTQDEIKGGVEGLAVWIQSHIQIIEPDVVCIPNSSAHHQDHRLTAEAAIIATRPSGATMWYRPPVVLEYEIASDVWPPRVSVPPQLTIELDYEDVLYKHNAMMLHSSQVRPSPSERSSETIAALAQLRGSQAGVRFGEAYNVLRYLI
jgi:N-acetylglucosamine malate deacetylase 1